MGDKEFVNVLEHGEHYKDEVNTFLKSGKFNNMQVAVCICAMQNLNVNNYVKLCNTILVLFNDNKLPEGLLQDAICPDFLHRRIIINNYNNASVAALLKSIENDKKVTNKDFRAWLTDIISGKSSRELNQFDGDSQSR